MTKEIIVDEEKEKRKIAAQQDPQAELQQKVLTYRILQSHLEQIRREAELIERRYIEIEATRQFLEDMKSSKADTEILLPVGNGMFAKGKLTDKKLLMDIGAGILSNKSSTDAESVVHESKAEIEATVKKLNDEMQSTVKKLNDLTPEIQRLQAGQ